MRTVRLLFGLLATLVLIVTALVPAHADDTYTQDESAAMGASYDEGTLLEEESELEDLMDTVPPEESSSPVPCVIVTIVDPLECRTITVESFC